MLQVTNTPVPSELFEGNDSQWVPGRIGGGLRFNTPQNTNNVVLVGDARDLNFSNHQSFSLAAWVRSEDPVTGTVPSSAKVSAVEASSTPWISLTANFASLLGREPQSYGVHCRQHCS